MDKQDDPTEDSEHVLIALDQISQTIDVMNRIVARLRNHVEHQDTGKQADLKAEMRSDRVLH